MATISFNGNGDDVGSVEAFGSALDRYDAVARFELWLSVPPDGPSLCMLRNADHAFLMYLRCPGDSGYVSAGLPKAETLIDYRLSNGQVDQYPSSFCIPVEQCYKALAYFFVNEGLRPEWITWHES